MDIIKFIHYFDQIKPTPDEIFQLISPTSNDVFQNELKQHDLKIITMNLYDDPVIDLIQNTNISDLYFSQFQFYRVTSNDDIIEIGGIGEKGKIFFNRTNKEISFIPMYEPVNMFESIKLKNCIIDQINFLNFLLKFLELFFNRIFRENKETTNITHDLSVDIEKVKKFYVFVDLLDEIEVSLEQLQS